MKVPSHVEKVLLYVVHAVHSMEMIINLVSQGQSRHRHAIIAYGLSGQNHDPLVVKHQDVRYMLVSFLVLGQRIVSLSTVLTDNICMIENDFKFLVILRDRNTCFRTVCTSGYLAETAVAGIRFIRELAGNLERLLSVRAVAELSSALNLVGVFCDKVATGQTIEN
jgi:hypothetical protein